MTRWYVIYNVNLASPREVTCPCSYRYFPKKREYFANRNNLLISRFGIKQFYAGINSLKVYEDVQNNVMLICLCSNSDFQFTCMSASVRCGRLTNSWFENDHSETSHASCTMFTSCHPQYEHHKESLWITIDTQTIRDAITIWPNT